MYGDRLTFLLDQLYRRMSKNEDITVPEFGASGYNHRQIIEAEQIVATDAGHERLVACSDSAVHIATDQELNTIEAPEGSTCDDIAVGQDSVWLLANGTIYPLTDQGFLSRSHDIDVTNIATPAMSSTVFARDNGAIVGFDTRTGRERFRETLYPTDSTDENVKIVAGERLLYVLIGKTVLGYGPHGRERLNYDCSAHIQLAGEVEDALILGLKTNRLVWINKENGNKLFSASVDSVPDEFATAGDNFLFGRSNNELLVIDSDGRIAKPGPAGADAIAQTRDGSLVGRITPKGFSIECRTNMPDATVETPDDSEAIIRSENPLPVPTLFYLIVEDEERKQRRVMEYSVNGGEVNEQAVQPLITTTSDSDSVTSVYIRVETDKRTLIDTDVDISSTSDNKPSSSKRANKDTHLEHTPQRGETGESQKLATKSQSESRHQLNLDSEGADSSQETVSPTEPTGSKNSTDHVDERRDAPIFAKLRPKVITWDKQEGYCIVQFQLDIRNIADSAVHIKNIFARHPERLQLNDDGVNFRINKSDHEQVVLICPRSNSFDTAEVEIEWEQDRNQASKKVTSNIPEEPSLLCSVERCGKDVSSIEITNPTETTIQDKLTLGKQLTTTYQILPGYSCGMRISKDVCFPQTPKNIVESENVDLQWKSNVSTRKTDLENDNAIVSDDSDTERRNRQKNIEDSSLHAQAKFLKNSDKLAIGIRNTTQKNCDVTSIELETDTDTWEWSRGLPTISPEDVVMWNADFSGKTDSLNQLNMEYKLEEENLDQPIQYHTVEEEANYELSNKIDLEVKEIDFPAEQMEIELTNRYNTDLSNLRLRTLDGKKVVFEGRTEFVKSDRPGTYQVLRHKFDIDIIEHAFEMPQFETAASGFMLMFQRNHVQTQVAYYGRVKRHDRSFNIEKRHLWRPLSEDNQLFD